MNTNNAEQQNVYLGPECPPSCEGNTVNASRDSLITGSTPVSDTIIERVETFLRRFVFFKDDRLYFLVATWIVATHLYELFDYTGYLFAYSAEPQSGKSRLLEVLDLLVFSSSGILLAPSSSVLFRTANGSTQLLDEVDGWTNKETLRNVLNGGFKKGNSVKRMKKDARESYEVESFDVYGPRALAGIGLNILDNTTRDRTFTFEMVRQKRTERREKLGRKQKAEAKALQQDIQAWAEKNRASIAAAYEGDEFPYLEDFLDRTIDVSQPLAAIVEVSYKDSSQLLEARLRLADAIALMREEASPVTRRHKILLELQRVSGSEDPLIGSASELAAKCIGLSPAPSQYEIASSLTAFGFKTKSIRKGAEPRYRYTLTNEELGELADRCVAAPHRSAYAATTPSTTAQDPEI